MRTNTTNEATGAASKTKPEIKREASFYVMKDGNGTEYKIANMNNPFMCKRKGIVEIEVIKKTNSMEPRYSISNVYDSELGVWFGIPLGIDSRTKEIKWQRFSVADFRRYDLTKHADAVEWAVMSRSSRLIGSAYQRGKPLYRQYDKEFEAREVIAKNTIRRRAMDIIDTKIKIEDYMDIYRNFGKNPDGHTPTTLQAGVIQLAERSPKEFVDMWENKNRPAVTLFNKCKALGMINWDIAKGGFMWKDSLLLGITEMTAIDALNSNQGLFSQARMEAEQKDDATKAFLKDAKNEGGEDEEVSDEELQNLRIQAKAMKIPDVMNKTKAELEAALEEIASVA